MFAGNMLSFLSARQDEQSNIKRMLARGTFYTTSITLASVPVLQVFALSNGASEGSLGIVRLFVQFGAIAGFLIFMGYGSRIAPDKLVRRSFFTHLAIAVLPLAMLLLSLFSKMLPTTVFLGLFTAGWTASSFIMSWHIVVYTRVESRLFASSIYGRVFGIAGIAYYLLGMVLSMGIKGALTLSFGFQLVFSVSLMLALASFITSRGFLLVKPEEEQSGEKESKKPNKVPRKVLGGIVFMHICRGIMSGVAFFFVPVALKRFALVDSDAGYISLLLSAGYLAGYLLIYRRYDKIGPALTIALGIVFQIVPFLILLFSPSRIGFLAFYFIFSIGGIMVDQGVPLGILHVIPSVNIGAVTAMRLVAFQATDAIFALGIGSIVVEHFTAFAVIYCIFALLVGLFAKLSMSKPIIHTQLEDAAE